MVEKMLKKLNLIGKPMDASALRSVKVVKPECHVPVQTLNTTQFTTGPCQQAVAHNPAKAHTWYLTCKHGPKVDSQGQPIPENMRCYYEQNIRKEETPIVGDDGIITGWDTSPRWEANLRIHQVALSNHTGGLAAYEEMLRKGCKPIADFGVAPFCEYYNCFEQDNLTKFKNGLFCSSNHARMVKARETSTVLCKPLPTENTGLGVQRRREQMQAIDV